MVHSHLSSAGGLLALLLAVLVASAVDADEPVTASIETTLSTSEQQIRQFAFDGNDESFFATAKVNADDHFTLNLEKPVAGKSLRITTPKPNGDGNPAPSSAVIEISSDGQSFEKVGDAGEDAFSSDLSGKQLKAVRIKPAQSDAGFRLSEIVIESDPPLATFKHPVEVAVDVSDAPDMQQWADNVARICERAYPMINQELASEGFTPARYITMTLKNDYRGVAATSGNRIVGAVKFFKDHPDDVGAMVHETVHVVQSYRSRRNPGWLVEGVADYVRFFKFEPGNIGPIDARRARYDRSYRVTAAFLAYLVEKYDKQIVLKLNKAMREGEYREELFKEYTGKTVQELDEEWRASLQPAAPQQS